ncbi:hypothetical protein OH687_31630 [Burkholderia anthina]|nr:hypothetical protein OH687_31630 [Burkholderia anthina]
MVVLRSMLPSRGARGATATPSVRFASVQWLSPSEAGFSRIRRTLSNRKSAAAAGGLARSRRSKTFSRRFHPAPSYLIIRPERRVPAAIGHVDGMTRRQR